MMWKAVEKLPDGDMRGEEEEGEIKRKSEDVKRAVT